MQTFDQSLYDLYVKGYIGYEEALAGASNRDEFMLRIQGVQSSSEQAREEIARITTRSNSMDDPMGRFSGMR
jgi:twitching motility protein PilT